MKHTFHPSILRAYDIRGTFSSTLFEQDAVLLARKIEAYLRIHTNRDIFTIGLVRDGRISSPILHQTFQKTLLECGLNVIDFGIGPSPMGYFAHAIQPLDGLVVITASHNPKDDNGFKILLNGKNLCGDDLLEFANLPLNTMQSREKGKLTHHDIHKEYGQFCANIFQKENMPRLKIAWDFSHGAMAIMASFIQENIPGEHFFVCDTLDGTFPTHDPDPTQHANLAVLQQSIQKHECDLGFAFDGDGDRLVVLDHTGQPIDGDRLVVYLAHDVLNNHPNATILSDIKASLSFQEGILKIGGTPKLTRTGHSFIKTKMKDTGALLAGEMSGHIFFSDESYGYDDGLYAACRVLRLVARSKCTIKDFEDTLPHYATTPEYKLHLPMEDSFLKFTLIHSLQSYLRHENIPCLEEDGIRMEHEKGWWLLRASNTENCLILRLEGRTEEDLHHIKAHYTHCIQTSLASYGHLLTHVL